MTFEPDLYYREVDMPFFRERIENFLPSCIVDIHAHVVGPGALKSNAPVPDFWAEKVCPNGITVPALIHDYARMFPGKHVQPVIFGFPSKRFSRDAGNEYVASQARQNGFSSLVLTEPAWSESELKSRVEKGGFVGLKPYPVTVEGKLPSEIEIYDFLPQNHLELADEQRWLIILHIPGDRRLDDPLNIEQLLEIDEEYPKAKIVVAHVGRSYCPPQGHKGLKTLRDSENLCFDISANTNQEVFERLIETVGPGRIVFGSDMPIAAMRARRICEKGNYVNIILNADWEDEHTRIGYTSDRITFFLYEEIAAFSRAAEKEGLGRKEIEKIFFSNAKEMLT